MPVGLAQLVVKPCYSLYVIVLAQYEADQGNPWILSQNTELRKLSYGRSQYLIFRRNDLSCLIIIKTVIKIFMQERICIEILSTPDLVYFFIQNSGEAVSLIFPAERLSACKYFPNFFHSQYHSPIRGREST